MFTLEVGMFSFFVLLFVIPVVLTLLSFRNERRRSPGMESVLNEPSPATRGAVAGKRLLAGGAQSRTI
jgi:hypothetical protein